MAWISPLSVHHNHTPDKTHFLNLLTLPFTELLSYLEPAERPSEFADGPG